jgi:hypothetical protein
MAQQRQPHKANTSFNPLDYHRPTKERESYKARTVFNPLGRD